MNHPILIVGTGIVGLTLGQALKKVSLSLNPLHMYERDPHPTSRDQGWTITLHWALQYIRTLLPEETLQHIQDAQIPPSVRWHLNREKMRGALLRGIEEDVVWDKRVDGVSFDEDGRPMLVFDGGETVIGTLVVGVEGSKSVVRRFLCPDAYRNIQLPIRFKGIAGCHPDSGVYFWFSIMETPALNMNGCYRVQICMSWPVKTPNNKIIRRRGERRVTLAGDAAHAMVMYRGEAANHGIIFHLVAAIKKIHTSTDAKTAIDGYKGKMREHTASAVQLSQQACLEAHVWDQLNENCAILSKQKVG
ncbi:hypothetical protein BDW59DRAFT_177106 [Aspergillus cavernicola]|uniref:FAD-binding domain-containing protein n=1 Tax=Aspergillus cavernicola TaxID=176166 RepID=A0ABR4H6E4_9EURO